MHARINQWGQRSEEAEAAVPLQGSQHGHGNHGGAPIRLLRRHSEDAKVFLLGAHQCRREGGVDKQQAQREEGPGVPVVRQLLHLLNDCTAGGGEQSRAQQLKALGLEQQEAQHDKALSEQFLPVWPVSISLRTTYRNAIMASLPLTRSGTAPLNAIACHAETR